MSETTSKNKNKAFKSVWVWAILGLFGLIFIVNYAFFSVAIGTNPGLVTEKYYKYGLQQNKFEKQYKDQVKRGWMVKLTLSDDIHINEPTLIKLSVFSKENQPVSNGHAELTAYRPSDAKADIVLALEETDVKGIYQAELSLPIQGVWDMNLLFAQGEDKHMLNQRISVKGEGNAEPSTLESIVNFISPN